MSKQVCVYTIYASGMRANTHSCTIPFFFGNWFNQNHILITTYITWPCDMVIVCLCRNDTCRSAQRFQSQYIKLISINIYAKLLNIIITEFDVIMLAYNAIYSMTLFWKKSIEKRKSARKRRAKYTDTHTHTHHVATLLQHQFTEMSHKSLLIYMYLCVYKCCVMLCIVYKNVPSTHASLCIVIVYMWINVM